MLKNENVLEVIYSKKNNDEIIPLFCPNCNLIMKDCNDPLSYRKYKVCTRCSIQWAEGLNEKKWLNGWRPSKEEVLLVLGELGIDPNN